MLNNYIKISFKVLLRHKFFTFVSLFGIVLTLTVLIVATATLDQIFSPSETEPHLDRTLMIANLAIQEDGDTRRSGTPGYQFLNRHVRGLPGAEEVALFSQPTTVTLYRDGAKINLDVKRTDGAYWRILDFELVEGRTLTDEDNDLSSPVVVINEATRSRLFDGEPCLGRHLTFDDHTVRVVGVVADISPLREAPSADVWIPISVRRSNAYQTNFFGDFLALILAPNPSALSDLKSEYQSALAEVEVPKEGDVLVSQAETFFEMNARKVWGDPPNAPNPAGRLKLAMIFAAILFMVLPSLNLINLNTNRILDRASEIGVRKAFGASSKALVGQFVVENMILTLLGGGLGCFFAQFILRLLSNSQFLPFTTLALNPRVLGAGLLMTLFFGLVSGVVPAWRMSKLHPVQALSGRNS